jgi:hypothetical protein
MAAGIWKLVPGEDPSMLALFSVVIQKELITSGLSVTRNPEIAANSRKGDIREAICPR